MPGEIAVTGSVAYDTIMVFPGHFSEHILPEKTHMLNVSFLVDRLEKRRGGTAANIAYTLALLGEQPLLCAAVGHDFADFGAFLRSAGVDTSAALGVDDVTTATCFITTDLDDNQITAFFPGAMARAAAIDLSVHSGVGHIIVAPDAPDAMAAHITQASQMGAKLVFAPAQQIPALDDDTLRLGLESAWLVVGNDYEIEMLRNRTGLDVDALRRGKADRIVAVTRGGEGSLLYTAEDVTEIPIAPVESIADPTGAGDAYIAGLLAGIRQDRPLAEAGRMGALAAAFVVERRGTQEHSFTREEFAARYASAFTTELSAQPA